MGGGEVYLIGEKFNCDRNAQKVIRNERYSTVHSIETHTHTHRCSHYVLCLLPFPPPCCQPSWHHGFIYIPSQAHYVYTHLGPTTSFSPLLPLPSHSPYVTLPGRIDRTAEELGFLDRFILDFVTVQSLSLSPRVSPKETEKA